MGKRQYVCSMYQILFPKKMKFILILSSWNGVLKNLLLIFVYLLFNYSSLRKFEQTNGEQATFDKFCHEFFYIENLKQFWTI